jgi:hypothetical protein
MADFTVKFVNMNYERANITLALHQDPPLFKIGCFLNFLPSGETNLQSAQIRQFSRTQAE